MDCMVHGVAKSQTRLSDFHLHFQSPSRPLWYMYEFNLCPLLISKGPDSSYPQSMALCLACNENPTNACEQVSEQTIRLAQPRR